MALLRRVGGSSGAGGEPRVTWTPNYDLRSTAGVEPDAAVAAMVARYEAQLDRELGQVIGSTETQLDTRGPVVRSGEAVFGNLVTDALLAATGAQFREALENGVSRAERNDGRFPQVAGLSFAFDVRRPPGSRVTRIEVAGAPIDEARTCTVATNDFMHTGGDGYTVLGSGEILIDAASGDTMANHLIDYVRAAGTVAPVMEGRIVRED